MSMSDYLEEKLINHTYGGTAFTQPSTWYIALFETDPTDAGGGTELSGGGYARQSFTPAIGASPTFVASNNADVVFPTATSDWNTINYVAVFDASTGGNMLDYGAITTPRTVLTDGVFKVLAGDLQIQYT